LRTRAGFLGGVDAENQRLAAVAGKQWGVVFQSPSLDKKLTVEENVRHQGHLYGLSGQELSQRIRRVLERVVYGTGEAIAWKFSRGD